MKSLMLKVSWTAVVLSFVVIMLGAFVRLSDAGLGCPDWPGCYGELTWPDEHHEINEANEAYPERPVETHKAWKEMVHRYLAGALGILVLSLFIGNFRLPADERKTKHVVMLSALIVFQALLGMWTVTLLLKPVIVMGHLLGGLATMAVISALALRLSNTSRTITTYRSLIIAAFIVLVLQISLGGWTSANYAAIACPDFPTCQNSWWPEADFKEAFVMWRGLGVDYEFGVLEHPARVAIHLAHRIGAIIALIVIGFLSYKLWLDAQTRKWGAILGFSLVVQLLLGITNIVAVLPLSIAVLHNGVAAWLIFVMVNIYYRYAKRA